jgi:two-component sensor histidine kinase
MLGCQNPFAQRGNNVGIGKLSRRLFLLTLAALLPAAIVLFYNLYSLRLAKETEIRDEAVRAGQFGALEIQRIISGAENVLIALSAMPVIQQRDEAGCQAYLARVTARLPQFSVIGVTDVHGDVFCPKSATGKPTSIADRPYFQRTLETGKFVVGEFTVGRVTKEQVLPLAMPVKDDQSKVVGVIFGALRLDWLSQRLSERKFGRNSALTVTDRNGVILARVPYQAKYVGTKVIAQYLQYVTAPEPTTLRARGRDGIERIFGIYPVDTVADGLFISAGISVDDAYGPIRRVSWISAVAALLSLLLSFILAWLTSKELIRRPVERLIATIKNWRGGDESAHTGMSESSGEFGVVGKAIDDFLCELVAARQAAAQAQAQRELLVHELDHRIKNLLATVQSVARQTFKDPARADDAVAGFVRRLAAMSEAHGLLMRDNWQSAGITDVVTAATLPFTNEIAPQFSLAGPDFQIRAKAVLSLSMALHELCTNAVKYGALKSGAGRVEITWSIDHGGRPEDSVFRMRWVEEGGPPVVAPQKFGFGSKMIERVLGYELEAIVETKYAETGVTCTLVVPLDRIRAAQTVYAAA